MKNWRRIIFAFFLVHAFLVLSAPLAQLFDVSEFLPERIRLMSKNYNFFFFSARGLSVFSGNQYGKLNVEYSLDQSQIIQFPKEIFEDTTTLFHPKKLLYRHTIFNDYFILLHLNSTQNANFQDSLGKILCHRHLNAEEINVHRVAFTSSINPLAPRLGGDFILKCGSEESL